MTLVELLKEYTQRPNSLVLANGNKVIRFAEWSDGGLTVQTEVEGKACFFVFDEIAIPTNVVFDKNGEISIFERASGIDVVFVVLTTIRFMGGQAEKQTKLREEQRSRLIQELFTSMEKLAGEITTQNFLRTNGNKSDKADRCLNEAFNQSQELVKKLYEIR